MLPYLQLRRGERAESVHKPEGRGSAGFCLFVCCRTAIADTVNARVVERACGSLEVYVVCVRNSVVHDVARVFTAHHESGELNAEMPLTTGNRGRPLYGLYLRCTC